jgi:hypothetical protein
MKLTMHRRSITTHALRSIFNRPTPRRIIEIPMKASITAVRKEIRLKSADIPVNGGGFPPEINAAISKNPKIKPPIRNG